MARDTDEGVEPVNSDRYTANGTLTLRGVSARLALSFDLAVANGIATATGTAAVPRLAFNIGPLSGPGPASAIGAVTFTITPKLVGEPPDD